MVRATKNTTKQNTRPLFYSKPFSNLITMTTKIYIQGIPHFSRDSSVSPPGQFAIKSLRHVFKVQKMPSQFPRREHRQHLVG